MTQGRHRCDSGMAVVQAATLMVGQGYDSGMALVPQQYGSGTRSGVAVVEERYSSGVAMAVIV